MNQKAKIVVADDHDFFRKGVVSVLGEIDMAEVVGEASNGIELLDLVGEVMADIVLLDIKMPKMGGIEVTDRLKSSHPDLKIIILSLYGEESYLKKMIELGADGFLLKNTDKEGLERAIRAVMQGNQYFSEEFMPFFTRKYISKPDSTEKQDALTKRELEVLQLIVQGYTTKEIAAKLFISDKTAVNHRTNLLSKTGSKNTATLIAYAIKNNLAKLE